MTTFLYEKKVFPISGMIARGKELANNRQITAQMVVIFDYRQKRG